MVEIVTCGIPRLDAALIEGKGFKMGSSILIAGTSGAGKELLAKQYAAAGVGAENVVYFSTDETSSSSGQLTSGCASQPVRGGCARNSMRLSRSRTFSSRSSPSR